MAKWQCPVCKANRITFIGECLTCLACGHQEYLYDYRNAHDEPMPIPMQDEAKAKETDLEDRIGNLESISAQAGRIPRKYYDEFQQIRGDVANLRNKVAQLTQRRREPVKSTYRGLTIEPNRH